MTKLTINRKPKGIYGTPQKTTQAAQEQDKTTSAHKVMPGNPQFLERCAGVPVIIDHPESKTLKDVGERSRIIGTVMLPYIRGDEVWGVCRIYGQEIIDYIQKARGEVSTSPSVVFCGASGGAEVPDVMGEDNFFY